MINTAQIRSAFAHGTYYGGLSGTVDAEGNYVDAPQPMVAGDSVVPSYTQAIELASAANAVLATEQQAPAVFLAQYGPVLMVGGLILLAFVGGFAGGRR